MSSAPSSESCAACEKPLDPLRAGQVAILDGRFLYFCNAACKTAHFENRPTDATVAPPPVSPSVLPQTEEVLSKLPPAAGELLPVTRPKSSPPEVAAPEKASVPPPKTSVPGSKSATSAPVSMRPAPPADEAPSPKSVEPDAPPPSREEDPVSEKRERSRAASWTIPLPILGIGFATGVLAWMVGLLGMPMVQWALAASALVIAAASELASRTYRFSRTHQLVCLATITFAIVDVVIARGANLGFAALTASALVSSLIVLRVAAPATRGATSSGGLGLDLFHQPSSRAHLELRLVSEWGVLVAVAFSLALGLTNSHNTKLAVATLCLGAAAAMSLQVVHAVFTASLITKLSRLEGSFDARPGAMIAELAEIEQVLVELRGVVIEREPTLVEVSVESEKEVAAVLLGLAKKETRHPYADLLLEWAKGRNGASPTSGHLTTLGGRGLFSTDAPREIAIGTRAMLVERGIGVARYEEQLKLRDDDALNVWFVARGDVAIGYVLFRETFRPDARLALRTLALAGIEPVLLAEEGSELVERVARGAGVTVFRGDLGEDTAGNFVKELLDIEGSTALVSSAADPYLKSLGVAVRVVVGDDEAEPTSLRADDLGAAAGLFIAVKEMSATFRKAFVAIVIPSSIVAVGIGFGLVPVAFGPLALIVSGVATARWGHRIEFDTSLKRPSVDSLSR